MINVTRTSQYSGKKRTIALNITEEQLSNFNKGMHVQKAFPDLPAHEREFILTGITKEEWDEMFPEEEE